MPANNDQYKDHELVQLATSIRTKFLNLKDLVHKKDIRLQQKIPTRKELISDAKVFTEMKDMSIRVLKAVDKKAVSAENKTGGTSMRVVQVDETLAKFLQLKKRGFTPIINEKGKEEWYYCDTLTLSFFSNWVVATNRQDGRNVKLDGADDPFIKLFGEDMKQPGTGPNLHASILSEDGEQLYPFVNNKHMTLFSAHYPRKTKQVGKESKVTRVVYSRDEYPEIYRRMEQERELLTGEMKRVRNEYKTADKKYQDLLKKKDQASRLGDNTLQSKLQDAEDQMNSKKRAYMRLLNENDFEHRLGNRSA